MQIDSETKVRASRKKLDNLSEAIKKLKSANLLLSFIFFPPPLGGRGGVEKGRVALPLSSRVADGWPAARWPAAGVEKGGGAGPALEKGWEVGRKRWEGPHEWAQGESGANACDRGGDCPAVATLLPAPSGGPAPPPPPLWLACSLLVGVGGWVDNRARSATALPQLAGGSLSSSLTACEGLQNCKMQFYRRDTSRR